MTEIELFFQSQKPSDAKWLAMHYGVWITEKWLTMHYGVLDHGEVAYHALWSPGALRSGLPGIMEPGARISGLPCIMESWSTE